MNHPSVVTGKSSRPVVFERYEVVAAIVHAWAAQSGWPAVEPLIPGVAPDATRPEIERAILEIRMVFGVDRASDGQFVLAKGRVPCAPCTPLDGPIEIIRAAIADLEAFTHWMGDQTAIVPVAPASESPAAQTQSFQLTKAPVSVPAARPQHGAIQRSSARNPKKR